MYFQVVFVDVHGEFKTSGGHVKNLASLTRTGDVSMEYDQASGALTVFGSLGLAELRVSLLKIFILLIYSRLAWNHNILHSTPGPTAGYVSNADLFYDVYGLRVHAFVCHAFSSVEFRQWISCFFSRSRANFSTKGIIF